MERTLVLLKPDAVQRRLVGRIVARFEDKGLCVVGMKLIRMSEQLAGQMYLPHKGKDFFEPLMAFMTSGPTIAMALEGRDAIAVVRLLMGRTFGREAAPGTVRGDFGMSMRHNLVHSSDSPEAAERETPLFFSEDELVRWTPADGPWVYEDWKG